MGLVSYLTSGERAKGDDPLPMNRLKRKLRKMTADILDLPQDVVYDLPG